MMRLKTTEKVVWVLCIVCVLWIGLNRTYFVGRINWADDFVWANRWDRVLAGQLPYRDFFELYGPGFPLLLAPLYNLLGRGLVAVRVIQYVFFPLLYFGILQAVFIVLNINRRWRIIGTLWVLFMFGGIAWLGAIPTRIWFGIGALLPLAAAIRHKSQSGIFVAGVFTVVVGILSTEQGVAALSAGIICLLFQRQIRKFLLPFLFGMGLMGLISVIGMSAAGMLKPYIETALFQVPLYQNAAYGFSFPGDDIFHHPFRLFWYLPFLLLIAETFWARQHYRKVTLPAIWLLVFAAISLRVYLGRTEIQSLAIALIPQMILATWIISRHSFGERLRYLCDTAQRQRVSRLARSLFFAVSLAGSFVVLVILGPYWKSTLVYTLKIWGRGSLVFSKEVGVWLDPQEAVDIRGVVEYLRQHRRAGEPIYPYAVISGFSTILKTTTPNYYEQSWFAQTAADQERLVLELVNNKVPWVIYSRRDDVIGLNQLSRVAIRSQYLPVAIFGDYTVMQRNPNPARITSGIASDEPTCVTGCTKRGSEWNINGPDAVWNVVPKTTDSATSMIIVNYRLRFFPGTESLSKTALAVTAVTDGNQEVMAIYKEPFLLPGGWQEAWVELPKSIKPTKLRLRLFWPGGLNPRATGVEWGEVRLI